TFATRLRTDANARHHACARRRSHWHDSAPYRTYSGNKTSSHDFRRAKFLPGRFQTERLAGLSPCLAPSVSKGRQGDRGTRTAEAMFGVRIEGVSCFTECARVARRN